MNVWMNTLAKMITWKQYKSKTEKYWEGKKVRTLVEMRNGNFVIPKGFILVIDRKYIGFTLKGVNTCDKCGIGQRIYITRVEPTELELVEVQEAQK